MPIPGTVPFTGLIAPTATTDTYPITDPLYGIDGLRSVASHTERDAIATERRRNGMVVYTTSDSKYWSLGSDLATWTEFAGGSPGGSDKQVQFNDSDSFGGDDGFTYDKTLKSVSIGANSMAFGINSHAGGYNSLSSLPSQQAVSDGAFPGSSGLGQCSIISMSIASTNTSPINMSIGGGHGETTQLTIRVGFTYAFMAYICGRKTDGTKHAFFMRQGLISNETGTTALIGSVTNIGTDNNTPAWAVAIIANDTTDTLQITVTGEANVRWFARIDLVEVGSG